MLQPDPASSVVVQKGGVQCIKAVDKVPSGQWKITYRGLREVIPSIRAARHGGQA
jgi:hypothetical protein